MSLSIDARGLSCPQPVILTRTGIQKGLFPIEVLVETVNSQENARWIAEKTGGQVSIVKLENE